VEQHKQGGGDAGAVAGIASVSLGDGSAEEGIRDLALMEALLASAQQQGGPVEVVQVL
jgi:hypothetical protein